MVLRRLIVIFWSSLSMQKKTVWSKIKERLNGTSQKYHRKFFWIKVLAGTATGIIIGLIPNAVLGAILKYFSAHPFAVTIAQLAVIFQLAIPLIIGGLIALQFGFDPMRMMVVAGSFFCWFWCSQIHTWFGWTGVYVGAGTGDIINTMLTASIAVGLIYWLEIVFGQCRLC